MSLKTIRNARPGEGSGVAPGDLRAAFAALCKASPGGTFTVGPGDGRLSILSDLPEPGYGGFDVSAMHYTSFERGIESVAVSGRYRGYGPSDRLYLSDRELPFAEMYRGASPRLRRRLAEALGRSREVAAAPVETVPEARPVPGREGRGGVPRRSRKDGGGVKM